MLRLTTRILLLATLVTVASSPATAAVLTVPGAFATIQLAINASTPSDIVLVDPGTYTENLTIGPAHDGITLTSTGGAAVTIIDGGRVTSVITCSNVGSVVIEGFTITNGGDDPPFTTLGGGLRLNQSSPTIKHNIITANYGKGAGGVYVDGGSPSITDNELTDNVAQFGSGGGIYYDHLAFGVFQRNIVKGNYADAYGGGMTVWQGSQPLIDKNQFEANKSKLRGGALHLNAGETPGISVSNNTFKLNESTNGPGGAVWADINTEPTFTNNRFEDNKASNGGGAIYFTCYGPAYVYNNVFLRNQCPNGAGGAVYYDHFTMGTASGNVFARNTANAGGGITIWEGSSPRLEHNTLAYNEATGGGGGGGGGLYINRNCHPVLERNIFAFTPANSGIMVADLETTVQLTCNDVYGNVPLNYVGLTDPTGSNGNISQDPLFCDPANDEYHLATTSPCSAAHSNGCDLIGALDAQCGAVANRPHTWGQLKARYR